MTYKTLKKHIKQITNGIAKKYGCDIDVNLDKDTDQFYTSMVPKNITIGIRDIYKKQNIPFTEIVSYIINTYHECNHFIQFKKIITNEHISKHTIAYCNEYDDRKYYKDNYFHSPLELDAQFSAIFQAQEYLHKLFPEYKDDVDQHILYWGKVWFREETCPESLQTAIESTNTLQNFITVFKNYKDTHHKQYIMDDATNTRITVEEYQLATFLANVKSNQELQKLVPALSNKEEIAKIRNRLAFLQTQRPRRDEIITPVQEPETAYEQELEQ